MTLIDQINRLNLIFLIKPFFHHDQKLITKLKYYENKKSLSDEIKNIFHHFQRAFNEVNNTEFSQGESSTFNQS